MTATVTPRGGHRPDGTLSTQVGDNSRAEILRGLRATPKTLPSKLFYDARGAHLFEQITTLEEYYLTRAELEALTDRAGDIATLAGPGCSLVELGSGAGMKARTLLDALSAPASYVPIDISFEQLTGVAAEMSAAYPNVLIRPLHADYSVPFTLPALPPDARRLAFFPGSTIGNLHPREAAALLARIRRMVGPTGALVLGVDRTKDAAALHAAYNDRRGITAMFNLNVLSRLNRELGADFDIARFRHRAWFNAEASRVEMHLESVVTQTVHIDGEQVEFARGERIWTESSYKYDRQQLTSIVAPAGFSIHRLWTDALARFWVAYLTPA
jgi:dimethylhistidine N-methyltransferase